MKKEREEQQAKVGTCIINPNSKWKLRWDIYIMVMMVMAAIFTPWQLAFVEDDTLGWIILNCTIDVSFLIDIIVTFFTAYYDEKAMNKVTDKKVIAKGYLKFWFWLDLLSIIPFDQILKSTSGDFGNMAKFTRVGRLYKMIRMIRMVKMIRLFKDRKKIVSNLDSVMKANAGCERLVFFLLGFIIFNHTFACVWLMLAGFNDEMNWRIAFTQRFLEK